MTTANSKTIAELIKRWQDDSTIPGWKKDGMIDLVKRLEAKLKASEDEHDRKNVELLFPEDCCNYDVFMTVACALEARVVTYLGGYIMRQFGKCRDFRGII